MRRRTPTPPDLRSLVSEKSNNTFHIQTRTIDHPEERGANLIVDDEHRFRPMS